MSKVLGTTLAHSVAQRAARETGEAITHRMQEILKHRPMPRKRQARLRWFLRETRNLNPAGILNTEIEGTGKNAAAHIYMWQFIEGDKDVAFVLYSMFARTGDTKLSYLVLVKHHAIARAMQTYKVDTVEEAMNLGADAFIQCWLSLTPDERESMESVVFPVKDLGEVRGSVKDGVLYVKTIISLDSMNPSKAERIQRN